jgi:tetratricopeptide (TPR) repeat protein
MTDPPGPPDPFDADLPGRDPIADALERADALTSVGRWEDAEAELRRALVAEPDDPALHAELGRVLLGRERPQAALEHLERSLAAEPEEGVVHALRGLTLVSLDLRRRREAVEAAREGVRLAPEEPVCHGLLARVCLAARWLPEAQDAAERAIALDPEDGDAHALLGTVLLARGRPGEAEAAYRAALARSPDDADVLHELGLALGAQGGPRRAESRELLRAAVRADPTDLEARDSLRSDVRRTVYGRIGRVFVAFAVLRAVLELLGDHDPPIRIIGALLWLSVAGVVLAFLRIRGRRRLRTLEPVDRAAARTPGGMRRGLARTVVLLRWLAPGRRGRPPT